MRRAKCTGVYDYACSLITGGSVLDVGCGNGIGMRRIVENLPGTHVYGFEEPSIIRDQCTEDIVHDMNKHGELATLVDMCMSKGIGQLGEQVDGNTFISLAIIDYVINDIQYWEQIIHGVSLLVDGDCGKVVITVPYKPLYPTVKECGRFTIEHNVFKRVLRHWFSHVSMSFARRHVGQFRIITKENWWRNCVVYVCE